MVGASSRSATSWAASSTRLPTERGGEGCGGWVVGARAGASSLARPLDRLPREVGPLPRPSSSTSQRQPTAAAAAQQQCPATAAAAQQQCPATAAPASSSSRRHSHPAEQPPPPARPTSHDTAPSRSITAAPSSRQGAPSRHTAAAPSRRPTQQHAALTSSWAASASSRCSAARVSSSVPRLVRSVASSWPTSFCTQASRSASELNCVWR